MFKRVKGWLGFNTPSIAALASGANAGLISTRRIDAITVEEAAADALIHSAVRIVASSVAQCEWSSPNKRVNAVLRKPNVWQTQFEFIFSIVHSLLVYGRAPHEITRSNKGVAQIDAIAPLAVSVTSTREGLPSYEVHSESGEIQRVIPRDRMLYFVDVPTAHRESVSRVAAASKRIEMLMTADTTAEATMRNGIAASWIAETDRQIGGDLRGAYLRELKDGLGLGSKNAGGLVFLDSGLKIRREKIGSPIDADMRQLRDDLKREIASSLGVPPFLIGADADTKYNNVSARMTTLHRETLYPLIVNIRQRFKATFGVEINCDEAAIESGNWQAQIETLTAASGKPVLTQNEARKKLRYPPIEGGDEMGGSPGQSQGDRRGEMPSDTGGGDGPDEE